MIRTVAEPSNPDSTAQSFKVAVIPASTLSKDDHHNAVTRIVHRRTASSLPMGHTTERAMKRPTDDDRARSEAGVEALRPATLQPPAKIARTVSYSGIDTYRLPDNFAIVAPHVYRSSFPKAENLISLKRLRLKSILTLVDEPYSEEKLEFLRENEIQHFQIRMPGNKENNITPVPDEKITAALSIILDRRNHPILIHCNKGKHRTGCVVGCLRRLQAWSVARAVREYCRFAGVKSREHDQHKIRDYKLEACLDLAHEHGWIPSTLQGNADPPLPVVGLPRIRAQ